MAKKPTDKQVSFLQEKPSKVSTTMAKPLALPNLVVSPQGYGTYKLKQPFDYPIDDVVLNVYGRNGQLLETLPTPNGPAIDFAVENGAIAIDLEQQLKNYNYLAGEFTVELVAIRNYLGAAQGAKLQIQEISNDRQEIRAVPALIDINAQGKSANSDVIFQDFFSTGFFELDKLSILPNLRVYWTQQDSVKVFDYIQDKFTIQVAPYSIIFKLIEPLPNVLSVDDFIWVTQNISEPITENVIVIPQSEVKQRKRIAGPNFDVNAKRSLQQSTGYKNWDSILTYASSSIIDTAYSQSMVEGIALNVDYTRFENFVHFGSAYNRLFNFTEKIKKIEYYQSIIDSVSTDLTGLANSDLTSSLYYVTQKQTYRAKIDTIKGAFDGFERYLYHESSSYVSNSFGEFLDMAWPKSTSTKPYTLYGSNTVQVENWLTGIYESASVYDQNNPHKLSSLVPSHILEDESNETALVLVDMIGHFFDVQYGYVDHFTKIYNRNQNLTEGFAKDLVYHVAQSLGADFDNGQSFNDLWTYTLGFNSSGSYDNELKLSAEDRTREVWKRIVNNLPYLMRTRGTERGLRALINCFGLPSTILRIREFGGPEPDFDTSSTYNHDRFYYALNVGAGDTTTSGSYIAVPWLSSGSTNAPVGLELRFKAAPFSGSVRRYNLAAWYSGSVGPDWDPAGTFQNAYGTNLTNPYGTLDVGRDSGGDFVEYIGGTGQDYIVTSQSLKLYIPTSSNSQTLFDGDWITLYLRRTGSAVLGVGVTGSYEIYAGKKTSYSETPLVYSASVLYTGSFSDTLGTDGYRNARAFAYWGYTGSPNTFRWMLIGSSSTPGGFGSQTTASFSGSIQEVRFWNQFAVEGTVPSTGSTLIQPLGLNLEQSPFYAHTLNPTTIVGANYANPNWTGATSSFNDLNFRLNLGTDNKKTNLDTTRSSSSYTSFIISASGIITANQFLTNYNTPMLVSGGFATASWNTASMSQSSNIADYPSGYDLYIVNMYNFGLTTNQMKLALDLFDAGYTVHTIGNDSTIANLTGSGGTTWPILSGSAAPANSFSFSGSKATGTYGVPSNHPIGFGWSNWPDNDNDSGRWIDKLNTKPGPNTLVYPLAVSGGLQLTTTPETNTTAHMLGFYAVNVKTGGRWVHTQNRGYPSLYFSSSGVIPNQIINFLLKRPDSEYISGSQPNQNSNWAAPTAFIGFNANTSSYWTPIAESNYTPWPDIAGNRQISNKIRVDETYLPSDQLYWNVKTEKGLQDSQPTDSPKLGVYLSTADQVNEDIAEQFGGIHLDDYIGSYADIYESSYDSLEDVQREYFKKYGWREGARFNSQTYIRLLSNFDGALFSLVKQFVPYRANLQTGLVVEPHVLHRPKIATKKPTIEDLSYESAINIPDQTQTPGGEVQDAAGGGQANYVWDAEIDQQYVTPVGDYFLQAEGSVSTETTLTVGGLQNEFNNSQVGEQRSTGGSLYSTVRADETSYGRPKIEGSQYDFYNWYKTGSGDQDWTYSRANSRDYWDPIQTTVLDSRKSETMLIADAGVSYNGTDIYASKGNFSDNPPSIYILDSGYVQDVNEDPSTGNSIVGTLGLRVLTTSQSISTYSNANHYWRLDTGNTLTYRIGATSAAVISTGSAWFNAFTTRNNQADYSTVAFSYKATTVVQSATMSVWFGTSGSTTTPELTRSFTTTTTTSIPTQTIVGPRANSDLYVEIRASGSFTNGGFAIDDLVVKHFQYAPVQDYHCGDNAATGQKNQKYNGSKLISTDWNEDSSDTIDGGPVISIIEGPSPVIAVNPNTNGTFTFR